MASAADNSDASWPVLLERGVALHRAGALTAAETLYRRVLDLIPTQADAINLLGIIALQTGKVESALSLGRQACTLEPANPSYHLALGNALRAARQFAEAADEFSTAISLRPDYVEAHNNLGLALADQNQPAAAIAAFERAVALQPRAAKARNNLGSALRRAGRAADAADACRAAIAADPGFAPAHNNLANALLDLDQLESAIAALREAIRLDPSYADAFANLCLAEYRAGNFDTAIAAGQNAVGLSPDSAAAHWNLAHALLIRGDFTTGFAEYEWRLQCHPLIASATPPRSGRIPPWTGLPLAGKTILLQAEQGLGDTIQFIRYAKLLSNQGATVILQCPPPLARLLARAPGISAIAEPNSSADYFCPLMSLPHRLGTTLATIPADIPYLTADPAWNMIVKTSDALHIGIAWAGRSAYANDRRRSMPLAAMVPLANVPGVRLHSLQIGPAARQIGEVPGMPIIDYAADIHDFVDTAALIENLDLVITVDTAVAHLAGAMGKPVWTLLPHVSDWRWLLDRPDSPWYPTMRLFRQQREGDWAKIIKETAEMLEAKAKNLTADGRG